MLSTNFFISRFKFSVLSGEIYIKLQTTPILYLRNTSQSVEFGLHSRNYEPVLILSLPSGASLTALIESYLKLRTTNASLDSTRVRKDD